jgi:hypothetical protein
MLDTILLDHMLWVAARVESTTEYLLELFVKTTNAQLFEVEILLKYLSLLHSITGYFEGLTHDFRWLAVDHGLLLDHTVRLIPVLRCYVLNLVDFDLQDDLSAVQVEWRDLPPVDVHAIKQSEECLENIFLVDFEGALLISRVTLIHEEHVDCDINRVQGVLINDLGWLGHDLVIF